MKCRCTPKPTPHKHAKLIKAWADGSVIQWFNARSYIWEDEPTPSWNNEITYRIKPEPKPDFVLYGNIPNITLMESVKHYKSNELWYKMNTSLTPFKVEADKVKYTFDGETGEIKNVEIIK